MDCEDFAAQIAQLDADRCMFGYDGAVIVDDFETDTAALRRLHVQDDQAVCAT